MVRQTLGDFLNKLGSGSPTPGGGSAAALSAALGTGLVEMVANLNDKRLKKKTKTARHAHRLSQRLLRLMALDAQAFSKLSKLYKKKKRGASFEEALKKSAGVPFEICQSAVKSLRLGKGEIGRTSRWLSSDLAEAGILLEAGFLSARLNVEINLKEMKNKAHILSVRKKLASMQKEASFLKKKLAGVFRP